MKRIDRELIRMLDAEGKSAGQIAEAMGCPKRTVTRIRRELGISHTDGKSVAYPAETREQALTMLEDGASYNEVSRTLGVADRTLRHWFPNMGWTTGQAAQYRYMLRSMEALDTRADRRVYSNL